MPSKESIVPRKGESFPFINVTPGSATESSQSRLLIRSHVGSWVWQQTKQNSEASNTDEVDNGHTHGADCNNIEFEAATSTTLSASLTIGCQTLDLATGQTPSGVHDDNGLDLLRSNDAPELSASGTCGSLYSVDYISVATLDPFQTYPSNNFPHALVNWCTKYCLSVMWPGFIPASPRNGPKSKAISSWFQLSWHDPTLSTLFLFAAASHQQLHYLRNGITGDIFRSYNKKLLMFLELESIKMVNEAIQNPSRALSDAVITSVACLVNNKGDELMLDENLRSPFQSPLRSLQWLDIYGSLLSNPVHLSGLAQLIKLRGGLEHIKLPGMSSIFSYQDILAASQNLSCPQFPFIPLEGDKNSTLQDQLGLGQTDLEYRFTLLCKIGFTVEMVEVFQAIKTYTSIVEKYQDGSTTEPDLCRINNQRNFVQHRLLSLLPARNLDQDFHTSHPVYEICRLAGLIFGVGVIFPLPAQTAPLPTLVKLLQAELQEQESRLESDWWFPDAVGVLIWVLTLGGIAATGLPNRTWFVAALGRVTACCGLSSRWRDLKPVLDGILWLDCACDFGGQQLWEEVDRYVLGDKTRSRV